MDNMEEYIQGENIFFEVIPLNKCQKKVCLLQKDAIKL
jgi:hypothetical protein